MNSSRLAGHVLLWCGFLGGAFVTVRNAEVVNDKWSTIQWPLYALALVTGVIGVVILRSTGRQAATHGDKLDKDIKLLEVSVQDLLAQLAKLIGGKQHTPVYAVHKLIDSRLTQSISDFVEARETLIHSYGLRQYAELMTDFSIAERNINRAWSASADGYVDEVWLSLERADSKLRAVAEMLIKCKHAEAVE